MQDSDVQLGVAVRGHPRHHLDVAR
jgi:hypothetical protein